MDKKVLLIAGGGTLGTYVTKELLKMGGKVDVVCLEDRKSDNENLMFYKERASIDFLTELFAKKRYDGIVNFLHYTHAEKYAPYHELLTQNTDQLIVLSSYRVYADLQHPITENAPLLADVVKDDTNFLEHEGYSLGKARCEKYIRSESKTNNWTIVRPVISFSDKRFDIVCHSGRLVIDAAESGGRLPLPYAAKNLTAGLDWAGNTGKIIAHLLFKKECLGETYTVSSGQNLTWGEVADCYSELTGVRFDWIGTEEYAEIITKLQSSDWGFRYDRLFDRRVDCSKVLKATGLKTGDFASIKDGIRTELKNIGFRIKG